MRENGLQAAARMGSPRGPRNHDGTIIQGAIDTMWGTDMTATVTVEHGRVAVFIAVDHGSAACVSIHVAVCGTRHEALELVRQGAAERFGDVEKDKAAGLGIRHDPSRACPARSPDLAAFGDGMIGLLANHGPVSCGDRSKGLLAFAGSQYMSRDFQNEITWLGATSSPAFVRAPEGNGSTQRYIRTLEENLLWVSTFSTVKDLRLALIDFRRTYHANWPIERHGHCSPAPFRRDQLDKLPPTA